MKRRIQLETANDWRVEEQRDLKLEAAKKPAEVVKMKDPGTSVLVTMNKEIHVPAKFEKLVKAKIKRHARPQVYCC